LFGLKFMSESSVKKQGMSSLRPHILKMVVIPECLCRESSDFAGPKGAGSPTQAFGDDDFVDCYFYVSFNRVAVHVCYTSLTDDFHKNLRDRNGN